MIYVLYDYFRDALDGSMLDRLFMVLDQLEFRALAAALVAFFIVLGFGRRVIDWLRVQKIGDSGLSDADALRAHSASKANTPTMGGVLIVGAIIAAVGLLADIRNDYVIVGMMVLIWLAGVGGVDDWLKLTAASRGSGSRQGLYAWEKLAFQLLIGALVGVYLFYHEQAGEPLYDLRHVLNLPFQRTFVPNPIGTGVRDVNPSLIYLSMPVFVLISTLMVAGMSNAMNITDGMDGLAAGVSTAVAIGVIALVYIGSSAAEALPLLVPYIPESAELVVLACAVAGACLGFLWWNCSPAQVFMGDTGSLALGGVLAYLAVVMRQEVLLLVMAGVALLEIASVVLQVGYFKYTRKRFGTGRRLFKIAPIHHHFHLGGWTENQIVVRAWIVTLLLVVIALLTIKVR